MDVTSKLLMMVEPLIKVEIVWLRDVYYVYHVLIACPVFLSV